MSDFTSREDIRLMKDRSKNPPKYDDLVEPDWFTEGSSAVSSTNPFAPSPEEGTGGVFGGSAPAGSWGAFSAAPAPGVAPSPFGAPAAPGSPLGYGARPGMPGMGAPGPMGGPMGGPGMGGPLGGPGMGGPGMGGLSSGMPGMGIPGQEQPKKSAEDVVFGAMGAAARGATTYSKGLAAGAATSGVIVWNDAGRLGLFTGIILAVVGGIYGLLNLFLGIGGNSLPLFLGGTLTAAVNVLIFTFTIESARREKARLLAETPAQEEMPPFSEAFAPVEPAEPAFAGPEESEDNPWDAVTDEEADEDEDWGSGDDSGDDEDDAWGAWGDDELDDVDPNEGVVSTDDALNSLAEITPGTQTRQFLFETFKKVLQRETPDFGDLKEISDSSGEFDRWYELLTKAADATVGNKEVTYDLLSVKHNPFIVQLRVHRFVGMKPADVAQEIANLVTYEDGVAAEIPANVTYQAAGTDVYFNIFDGRTATVTLGDAYADERVKNHVLNVSYGMPMVIGVNEIGRPWLLDFQKLSSLILSGKPRTGKSWETLLILFQMAMYLSPSELEIHIGDVKGQGSDYYALNLPHIRNFVSSTADIMEMLRWIIEEEAPRRQGVLAENGVVNLNDLLRKNPDAGMSRLYLIIDEMAAFASLVDKEEWVEYGKKLKIVTTSFPNLGIVPIFIPHRIRDEMIPTTVSRNVAGTIMVLPEDTEIKGEFNTNSKTFPYTLVHVGDSAARMPLVNQNKPFFNRCLAPAKSNEDIVRLSEYIGKVWQKLDPEGTAKSWKDVNSGEIRSSGRLSQSSRAYSPAGTPGIVIPTYTPPPRNTEPSREISAREYMASQAPQQRPEQISPTSGGGTWEEGSDESVDLFAPVVSEASSVVNEVDFGSTSAGASSGSTAEDDLTSFWEKLNE